MKVKKDTSDTTTEDPVASCTDRRDERLGLYITVHDSSTLGCDLILIFSVSPPKGTFHDAGTFSRKECILIITIIGEKLKCWVTFIVGCDTEYRRYRLTGS